MGQLDPAHACRQIAGILHGYRDRVRGPHTHVAASIDQILFDPGLEQIGNEVYQIALANCAEIKADRTGSHKDSTLTPEVIAPGRSPVDPPQMTSGIGLQPEGGLPAVAQTGQVLAHHGVQGPVGGGIQPVI